MRRAFTLIELLVVIAIIAVLAALIFPVFASVRGAAYQMVSGRVSSQMYQASTMYASDSDDVLPLAFYVDGDKMMTWFGRQTTEYEYDNGQGLISPYTKGGFGGDPTLYAEPYIGDRRGIGYNWGVLGSDMHITGDYSKFPNCSGAAALSSLEQPSRTVMFASSAYYSVPWRGGDNRKYQFNFISPMETWDGVPDVDFRYIAAAPRIDSNTESVVSAGNAVFTFADGNTRYYKQSSIKSEWFWRTKPEEN